nr:peptidoglycan-binding protein [Microbispora rosea]
MVKSIQSFHMDGNGWIDIGYCVDEETEILTRRGWRTYKELRAGDIALTLNHETGMTEWQPVLEVCVFPAREREMIRMRGDLHSSLTTPDHRWPVERHRRLAAGSTRRFVTARERVWATTETLGHRDRILLAAPCADLPGEAKWSDALVELVAWFCAEDPGDRDPGDRDHGERGQGEPASRVVIRRSGRNAANAARVAAALRQVFGPPREDGPPAGRAADGVPRWREAGDLGEFHLSAGAGEALLGPAPGRVPAFEFLLSLTRAQLALFVETCLAAGGAADRLVRGDRAAAEAFMFAVLLSGRAASLRRLPPTATCPGERWLVTIERRHGFAPRGAAATGSFTIRREPYRGEIWCPRTENQSWLARRDGTVYFTGNTMVACPHRKVFVGRGPGHLPAANGPGLNSGHYAVLGLVGNAGLVQPTDGVLHAILDAVEYLRAKGGAGKEIKGHRDGYSTDCPGGPLYAWIKKGAPRPGAAQPQPEPKPGPRPTRKWPGRLLKYPPVMRGDDVRAWQARMKALGYDLAVDGAYGPESRDVCRKFQRDRRLDVDGIVGPVTWNAAFAAKP